MKKLIVVIGAIAIAAVSNAATFSWKLQTGATYSGMNVYALTGTSAATVLAACSSDDASKWAATFDGFASVQATGTNARAGATGDTAGVAGGDNLVWVIVDGAVADGSKYWVVNDYAIPTESVYEPPASGTIPTVVLSTQGTAGSGTFTAGSTPVPEPTSGLLMLLGMAGLALRRGRRS